MPSQFHKVASRYYQCNCSEKKQAPKLVPKLCSDYIIHQQNIFVSGPICSQNPNKCSLTVPYLFTISIPHLKQTFLYQGGVKSQYKKLQRHSYVSDFAHFKCGEYHALQQSVLNKYYEFAVSDREKDILDVRQRSNALQFKDILADMNILVSHHAIPRISSENEKVMRSAICGSNAPCCTINKIELPQAEINGLACRTNKTLNFFTMDAMRYKKLLENIGVVSMNSNQGESGASLLVVDLQMKSHFVMPKDNQISETSIGIIHFCVIFVCFSVTTILI